MLKKLAELVNSGRITGVSNIDDFSDRKQPVRIVVTVKKGEDPNVVLNQLYEYSPLQDSFSIIMLALVNGRPRTLPLLELLRLFVEHRINVIRRRTQHQLRQARRGARHRRAFDRAQLYRRDHPGDPELGQSAGSTHPADGDCGLGRDPQARAQRPRSQGINGADPEPGGCDPVDAVAALDGDSRPTSLRRNTRDSKRASRTTWRF